MSRNRDGAYYKHVESRQWTVPAFRKLSLDDRAILLYFQTCQHSNAIGAYGISLATAAAEIDRPQHEIEKAVFGSLAAWIVYDPEYLEILLPDQGRIQTCPTMTKDDNRWVHVHRLLRSLNSPLIVTEFLKVYEKPWNLCLEGASQGLGRGLEGASEANAVPKQYQEHFHNSAVPGPSDANGAVPNVAKRQQLADREKAGTPSETEQTSEPYSGFATDAEKAAEAIGGPDNLAWLQWIRGGGEQHLQLAIGLRLEIDASGTDWDTGETIRSPVVFAKCDGLRGQAESAYYRSLDSGRGRSKDLAHVGAEG